MNPKILIVDGNNLAHMAHGRQVMTHNGERTEVLYLGLSMLNNNLKLFEPDRMVVVWDGGKDERRKAICPEYKGHRRKDLTEQEQKEWELFFEQMEKLQNALWEIGITQFYLPGREADDIIFNIILWIIRLGAEAKFVVMSTDKDFLQLLTYPDVFVYNPVQKKEWTRAVFTHEFRFEAKYYLDWKAMVGDASDNLKGIKGIGEKNATMLVKKVLMAEGKIDNSMFTDSELRYVQKMLDNFDEFNRMRKIMSFYNIPQEELKGGKQKKDLTSVGQMQDNMMQVLSKYGLQRFIKRFPDFVAPFEQLFIKESKK